MEVENVDVVGSELFERVSNRNVKRLLPVSRVVDTLVLAHGVGSVGGLRKPVSESEAFTSEKSGKDD